MDMPDSDVIQKIREGNINRFDILVERYSSKLHQFIRARLFDKSEADDIVQMSFIQFYKALSQFDSSKPVYPYLLQIAKNELYMFFRKNHPSVSLNDDIIQMKSEDVEKEDITEIVKGLKPVHKNALVWFAEGYSYKEISLKLGKPLNTVRTLIRRARLFVQKKYTNER